MKRRVKEILICATVAVTSLSHGALVGEWLFEDTPGGTAANTAPTGNTYDGTVIGSPSWVAGHDGGTAIDFGGTSGSYVSVLPVPFASISNEISITFWAYGNTNQPAGQVAFQGQVGTGGRELQSHLPWENGRIYWDAADRYDFGAGGQSNLWRGAWTYWVMTKNTDTGQQRVYANGTLIGNGTGKQNLINGLGLSRFAIGGDNSGGLTYQGIIDDFRVYDHELSYQEIAIGFDPNIVVAQIERSEGVGENPFEVYFDGSSSFAGQGIAEYLWDFGSDPSNVVIDATGAMVTNTFTELGVSTVTLYVVDGAGATNSASTPIEVLESGGASEIIDIDAVDDPTYTISSQAHHGSSILFLLTDTFGYHPNFPTAYSPATAHSDGFHGDEPGGADIWLSFTNATPYTTVASNPVIVMDVWGRQYNGAEDRDDDFDVILYNGSWDEADIVGDSTGNGVDDASNYTRVIINTLPVGTTFDRVRIVGHQSSNRATNPFTLTEIRLAAVTGELTTVVAKVGATPESGFDPLEVTFDATASYAVAGAITEYLWDYGDGVSESGTDTAVHTYTTAGSFTNTLTVINDLGDTNTAQVVITAISPIYATISASTNMAYIGVDIGFDASASTNAVPDALTGYDWDFGGSGVAVSNAFATAGVHTVTLTITDAAGRVNTATTDVEILALPVLGMNGSTMSWDTPHATEYEVQYCLDLVGNSWLTLTNLTATPPTTSVELPMGRDDVELFRVRTQ